MPVFAANGTIHLSAPNVLGTLGLDDGQLKSIKAAIEKSLQTDIIDAVVECGEDRMDCEVRTAREWSYNGDNFREVVVNVHTVGNTLITLRNHNGKWPDISVK
ncbi:MAG: hypothetical protein GC138_01565 [Gammaproteobacteria bacterium]|nr:hypothetical protein [Gammaproteobacteria bacterium]